MADNTQDNQHQPHDGPCCSMCHPLPPEQRPTPEQAREGLMRLFSMTRESYDRLEAQFKSGRIADTAGFDWFCDPESTEENRGR